jgi:hypothetical protein
LPLKKDVIGLLLSVATALAVTTAQQAWDFTSAVLTPMHVLSQQGAMSA